MPSPAAPDPPRSDPGSSTKANTHRISCGLSRFAVEVPTCVPYCCDTAAALCRSSSSATSLDAAGIAAEEGGGGAAHLQ